MAGKMAQQLKECSALTEFGSQHLLPVAHSSWEVDALFRPLQAQAYTEKIRHSQDFQSE